MALVAWSTVISFIAAGIHFAGAAYRQVNLEKTFLAAGLGTFAAFILALVGTGVEVALTARAAGMNGQ